tara:strand:+ start:212 stop:922 length:711 start_codon:yes stop_codon:yes gene_type:complete
MEGKKMSIMKRKDLDIPKDKIGLFVGKSGYNIKYKMVLPTKRICLGESDKSDDKAQEEWKEFKIYCNLKTDEDDQVFVEMNSPDEKSMKILESHIDVFVKEFKKNISKFVEKKEKKRSQINYSFNLKISDGYVSKLIGVEGSSIRKLSEQIKTTLKFESYPYIKFVKDKPHNATDIIFKDLKRGDVGLIVSINGAKCFELIKTMIEDYVNDMLKTTEPENEDDKETESEDELLGEW